MIGASVAREQAGTWYWARRSTRWDVYPQRQPLALVRTVPVFGELVDVYLQSGAKAPESYELARECRRGPIDLTPGAWPLRGAASHDDLVRIVTYLRDGGSYDDAVRDLQIDRATVESVARHYQSLWSAPW